LGASPARIQRLILREGLGPVVVGILAGGGLAVIARMSLRPMFQQLVPATDLLALAAVPALLLLAGTVAAMLPARRAARVNPNVALRDL
jgi:ABC-type antimicrobial peptide transport system permease subunit